MQVKDVGLFLILGIVLDLVGVACSTAILVMYNIQPGLRGMFIALMSFLGLNVLIKLISFNSTLYRAPSQLKCIMIMSVVLFTLGTIVVGISFGKANYWEKTLFGGDGASIPLLFLAAIILTYLVYIFIMIRCKEMITDRIRKGEISKDEQRKIRDVLCGDLYETNDEISNFAGRGKYVQDQYVDRRKKPSFNNKKRGGAASRHHGGGSNKRDASDDSFDGPPTYSSPTNRGHANLEEGRPILHNPSPIRAVALPMGGGTSPTRALQKKTTRQPVPVSPPRQYVQTPSLLDSSMSSAGGGGGAGGSSPRRARVVP
jgi:hypothetical protein